jgi:protein-disulfide isomerase
MFDIKEFIRRRYFSEPGARVVRTPGLALEVTTGPGQRDLRVFHDARNLSVILKLAGAESVVTIESPHAPAWQHKSTTEASAERLYGEIRRQLARGGRSPRRGFAAGVLATVTAVVVYSLLAPSQQRQALASAPVGAAVAAPLAPTNFPAQARTTPQERDALAALPGKFTTVGSGAAYYVFSDPNCPFCKQLEASMAAVKNYKAVVMPLGYKEGSKDLSAAVLCSPDPAKEWAKVIGGMPTSSKPCEKGYAQVAQNMKLFEDLRLSSTPTLVTPNGILMTGAASPQDLAVALAQ